MARNNTLVQRLPENQSSKEPTSKCITCAIGIHNFAVLQRVHLIHLRGVRLIRCDHDGRQRTLSNDDCSRAGRVGFREGSEGLGDGRDVVLVWETGSSGPSGGFGFVADDDVTMGEDLFQLDFEELRDERCGDVDNEYLCWARAVMIDD